MGLPGFQVVFGAVIIHTIGLLITKETVKLRLRDSSQTIQPAIKCQFRVIEAE